MKKVILWISLTAFAMASCSQNESVSQISNTPVGFGTFVKRATKGTPIAGSAYPADGQFLVLGYNTETTDIAPTAALNFMRQNVTYDGTSYTYFPIRYWPFEKDSKVSFFAVHPASVQTTVTPSAVSSTPDALPVVTLVVNPDPVKQADLMLASALNKTQTDGTINFSFAHALTKIGFSAKLAADYGANGTYIRVTNISLKNVVGTGVFSFGPTGTVTQTAPTDFSSTFSLNYLKHFVDNGSVSGTSFAPLNLDNSYLLMVPNIYSATSGATAALEITYVISSADGTKSTVTSSTLLKDIASNGNEWTAAKSITYNLTITLNAVNFSAGTVNWGDETVPLGF